MEERVGRPIRVEITSNRKQKQNKKTKRHKIMKTVKEQNNSIYTNKQTRQGAVFGIMVIWHYIFVFI